MTSEMIFHAGLAVIGCSAVVLAVGLSVISSKKKALDRVFDREYGLEEQASEKQAADKQGADKNG